MPRYFAFLRAINVGGHTVKMDDLRRLFEGLGFVGVESFIASGNLMFEAEADSPQQLEGQIEARLRETLGYAVAAFIRTPAELAAIASCQPFPEPQFAEAVAFNVAFLKDPLNLAATQQLLALKTEIDDLRALGREVYWLCRKKQSQSTFSNAVLEKTLGQASTLRGMNTLQKLANKLSPPDSSGRPAFS
jgi:uncharacterized protein (DUF1697 family)